MKVIHQSYNFGDLESTWRKTKLLDVLIDQVQPEDVNLEGAGREIELFVGLGQ